MSPSRFVPDSDHNGHSQRLREQIAAALGSSQSDALSGETRRMHPAAAQSLHEIDEEIDALLATENPQPLSEAQIARILDGYRRERQRHDVAQPSDAVCRQEPSTTMNSSVPDWRQQDTPRVRVAIASSRDRVQRRRGPRNAGATLAVVLSLALLLVVALTVPRSIREQASSSTAAETPPQVQTAQALAESQLRPLRPRPRPEAAQWELAQIGDILTTGTRQRRSCELPDGSLLFMNSETRVDVIDSRRMRLVRGEIFLDVAQRKDRGAAVRFEVETSHGRVVALGTRFALAADSARADLVVTQGAVSVAGREDPVRAGQAAAFSKRGKQAVDIEAVGPARRATDVLNWTRELIAAAEEPLVPRSEHAGGSLIAVLPDGHEARLSLRKFHIDVHIEDGFARTTIDQTFFNHSWQRLEGTFHFPLPADASLSRLAMYVGNTLMEGGMVERNHGRNVFEQILHTKRDPALLEWVDGTTFKMRVFPLEARQEKRIILSYTQRLPVSYESVEYRFPAGHSLQTVQDWSTRIRIADAAGLSWSSPSHELTAQRDGNELVLEGTEQSVAFDHDLVLRLGASGRAARRGDQRPEAVQFDATTHEGYRYLMLRWRPGLPRTADVPHRNWIVVFEASADRDPLLARTQIEILRQLLRNVEHADTFSVVCATGRVATFDSEPRACTKRNLEAALDFLENQHLVGALNLEKAFRSCRRFVVDGDVQNTVLHLGGSLPVQGETDPQALRQQLPDGAQYVGLGVGRRWSRQFMELAASATNGLAAHINPDDEISWRALDVLARLNSPRLLDVRVAADRDARFLVVDKALSDGDELCAVARWKVEQEPPERLTITGSLEGKAYEQVIPIGGLNEDAGYLPRFWARLQIDRMVAALSRAAEEQAARRRERIIQLSKRMYVMSPFTSLLVLENDEMYEQFQVDRGRKDHWALYPCPDVLEPQSGHAEHRPNPSPPRTPAPSERILVRRAQSQTMWIPVTSSLDGLRFTADARRTLYATDMSRAVRVWSRPDDGRRLGLHGNEQSFEWFFSNRGNGGDWDAYADGRPTNLPLGWRAANLRWDESRWGLPQSGPSSFRRTPNLYFGTSRGSAYSTAINNLWFDAGAGIPPLVTRSSRPLVEGSQARSRGREIWLKYDALMVPGFGEPLFDLTVDRFVSAPSLVGLSTGSFVRDLTIHAPGLNSTNADRLAARLRERGATAAAARKVDPAARKLLQSIPPQGWREVTVPAHADQPCTSVSFNAQGAWRIQRTVSLGLHEEIVCDGRSVWHVYEGLGLAAKRVASPVYTLEVSSLVPWYIPPVEQLEQIADIDLVAPRTVSLTLPAWDASPESAEASLEIRLRCDAEGRLVERQHWDPETGQILERWRFPHRDRVEHLDGNGDVIETVRCAVMTVSPFQPRPNLAHLVVLPLPFLAADGGAATSAANEQEPSADIEDSKGDSELTGIANAWATGNAALLQQRVHDRFLARGDHRIGFYVLLAAEGVSAATITIPEEAQRTPLGRYLRDVLELNRTADMQGELAVPPRRATFLYRLARLHNLRTGWNSGRFSSGRSERQVEVELTRTLEFAEQLHGESDCASDALAAQCVLLDAVANSVTTPDHCWRLAEFAASVAECGHAVRSELAERAFWIEMRLRLAANDSRFADRLHEELGRHLRHGQPVMLPAALRSAIERQDESLMRWVEIREWLFERLLKNGRAAQALSLLVHCSQLGDPLTDRIEALTAAHHAALPEQQRRQLLVFLMEHERFETAELLFVALSAGQGVQLSVDFWQAGARLAAQRGDLWAALNRDEVALALQLDSLPDVMNLEAFRERMREVLNRVEALVASEGQSFDAAQRERLVRSIVGITDRWRILDPGNSEACQTAARLLGQLGRRELAWEYATTPLADGAHESQPWLQLARYLQETDQQDLAADAYAAAYQREPTNPEILREHALLLESRGQSAAARALWTQIANGQWQPRFAPVQQTARQRLGP